MKDDKKLNEKHIKIQMTQPSFKTWRLHNTFIFEDILIVYSRL